jgi:hypothetical protein
MTVRNRKPLESYLSKLAVREKVTVVVTDLSDMHLSGYA